MSLNTNADQQFSNQTAPLQNKSVDHFVFPLQTDGWSVETLNRWVEKGWEREQIWGAMAHQYARLIERNYHVATFTDQVNTMRFAGVQLEEFASRTFPRGNIAQLIMQTVGHFSHLNICLNLKASNWRLVISADYFPF